MDGSDIVDTAGEDDMIVVSKRLWKMEGFVYSEKYCVRMLIGDAEETNRTKAISCLLKC